jgi:AcrR family transcriptional regulator
MRELPGEFGEFRKLALLSIEEISREIYRENREAISVKKEHLAIKNLGIIFDATLKLSVEKGFHAMSLRDLCRESGISMGALYSYIPGKEKLLDIILQQGRRIVKKTLEDALEGKENPVEKLHAAVRAHIFLSEVLQRWFFFAFMETKNLSREEQKAAMASELYTEKIFIDILEKGSKSGVFTVKDASMTAGMIKALLQDWYLKRWKYSKRGVTVGDYADSVISAIDAMIMLNRI